MYYGGVCDGNVGNERAECGENKVFQLTALEDLWSLHSKWLKAKTEREKVDEVKKQEVNNESIRAEAGSVLYKWPTVDDQIKQ